MGSADRDISFLPLTELRMAAASSRCLRSLALSSARARARDRVSWAHTHSRALATAARAAAELQVDPLVDPQIGKALSSGRVAEAATHLLHQRKHSGTFCVQTHRAVIEALVMQKAWSSLGQVVHDMSVEDWHAVGGSHWQSTLWACAIAGKSSTALMLLEARSRGSPKARRRHGAAPCRHRGGNDARREGGTCGTGCRRRARHRGRVALDLAG